MLVVFYYFFVFISGTFVGSFLNLVSDRVKTKESMLFGRSHCDSCYKPLLWKNLIPLFSYIFQKGRCAFCKEKLSILYPVSEFATGLMFVLAAYLSKGEVLSLLFYAVTFCFFIILFLTDIKYYLIPNKIVYIAIIFVAGFLVISQGATLLNLYRKLSADPFGVYLLKAGYWNNQLIYSLRYLGLIFGSAFLIGLFFWFLVYITKGRGMGGGDIKLGFLIGLFNGFPLNIMAIFLGFVLGALYSTLMMVLKRKTLKDTIAFGPFLIIGSVISLVYGNYLLSWYMSLL